MAEGIAYVSKVVSQPSAKQMLMDSEQQLDEPGIAA